MAWFTDTSSAPKVYLGRTDIQDHVFLRQSDTNGVFSPGFTSYTGVLSVEKWELRGLADTTADAAAIAYSLLDNTSAIVTRANEGGGYNVIITVETATMTEDT